MAQHIHLPSRTSFIDVGRISRRARSIGGVLHITRQRNIARPACIDACTQPDLERLWCFTRQDTRAQDTLMAYSAWMAYLLTITYAIAIQGTTPIDPPKTALDDTWVADFMGWRSTTTSTVQPDAPRDYASPTAPLGSRGVA